MLNNQFFITTENINEYILYLKEEERASNTIEKYSRDIKAFANFLSCEAVTKERAITWKENLKKTHTATSINSMIAAINNYFDFYELGIKIKPLKIQKKAFLPAEKELTKEEYEKLLYTAKSIENDRLYHVIQTICATGIRVSELKFITVETVKSGWMEVTNKGKTRIVFIPDDLRTELLKYIKRNKIQSSYVFATKNGKPLNRSNIWADMKKLCIIAGVEKKKVFPHSLRALFSRMFHNIGKDLAILADVLGHSDVNTTRIYVKESSEKYRMIIENLGLAKLRYST